MSENVVITTLVENTVNLRGLRAEHGLAFLIQAGERKILFDTGQSELLLQNAKTLGISLEDVEVVALSHGHYDHSGGIQTMCEAAPNTRFYLHPQAITPKFAQNPDGTGRYIGIPPASIELLRQPGRQVTWTPNPTEIITGVFLTGEIPRRTSFEDTGGRFFLDAGCTRADPLLDDQALYFDAPNGLVIVLGCAHSGVVNTVAHIQELTSGRPVHALMGGMHLLNATPERMNCTLEELEHWATSKIIPAHCTGSSATARLWAAFPGRCSTCSVGTKLVFSGSASIR